MLTARARAQAIALRRGGRHTLAVPSALRLAARIAERPWETFLTDPTQLANGLGDLLDAVRPDGVAVTAPGLGGVDGHLDAALEATRRLRVSAGDTAVLVAVLDAGPGLVDTVRAFLDAGADGVVLAGEVAAGDARTVGNVARFHRAMAYGLGPDVPGLPGVGTVPLDAPAAAAGLVLTDGEVPGSVGVPAVQEWVTGVRGG